MKMRFSIIPSRAVADKQLSNGAFRTLGALCCFTSSMGIAYPNQTTLANVRHCTQSNINQQLQQLRRLGYIYDLVPKGRKRRGAYQRGCRYYVPVFADDPIPSWELIKTDYVAETRKASHDYT